MRQLGGVFGVAAVAAVFARNGSYATPATFIAGFKPALATVAGTATLGAVIAAFAPRRTVRPVEPGAPVTPATPGAVNGNGFVQDAVAAADFSSPAIDSPVVDSPAV